MEEWKEIEGYPNYMVSNMGRVKSLGNDKNRKEKILKCCKDSRGYLQVQLYTDGKGKKYLIHRLVASAFIANHNNLPEINHIDENPQNNCVDNLEYCDRKYNNNYGTHNEKMAKSLSIPILQFTKSGEYIKKWGSMREVERELGICNSDISKCCKGKKYKTAGGYAWMYANIGVFEIDINKLKKVA